MNFKDQKHVKDKRKHRRGVCPTGASVCVLIESYFEKAAEVPGHIYVNRKPRKDERGCPVEGEGQNPQKNKRGLKGCLKIHMESAEPGGGAAHTSAVRAHRFMVPGPSAGFLAPSSGGFWDTDVVCCACFPYVLSRQV